MQFSEQFSDIAVWSMVIGMLYGQITKYLISLLEFLKDLFISNVELNWNLEYFEYAHLWLVKQKLISSNRITIKNNYLNIPTITQIDIAKDNLAQLSNGTHIFWYKKMLMWVSITERKDYSTPPKLSISIPFAKLETMTKLVEEIQRDYKELRDKIKIWNYNGNYWSFNRIEPRPMNKIILPKKIKNKIIEDFRWFLNNENWYKDKGLHYHRGYLFHGLPGTGKTSLAIALAKKFDLPIYCLPISSILNSNQAFVQYSFTSKSIILIEDLDKAIITDKEDDSKSEIKLQQGLKTITRNLLQILDGTMTPHGSIFIITTNDKSSIDPVLLRAGRADQKYKFEHVRPTEIKEMFLWFFPGEFDASREFINSIGKRKLVMAEIQEHLLRNSSNISQAKIFEKEKN